MNLLKKWVAENLIDDLDRELSLEEIERVISCHFAEQNAFCEKMYNDHEVIINKYVFQSCADEFMVKIVLYLQDGHQLDFAGLKRLATLMVLKRYHDELRSTVKKFYEEK